MNPHFFTAPLCFIYKRKSFQQIKAARSMGIRAEAQQAYEKAKRNNNNSVVFK